MIEPLVAVITLPVLAPIVALLQLLFPSLMRNQYQQYKAVIHTSLAQSSLMGLHWVTVQWLIKQRTWWLSDEALSVGLLTMAAVGLVVSLRNRALAQKTPPDLASGPPSRLEVISLALFAALGIGWAIYQARSGGSMLDPMFALTVACVLGLIHLGLRSRRPLATKDSKVWFVSTEVVLLATAVVVAGGILLYQHESQAQQGSAEVITDWPTYRGDAQRTGARDSTAPIERPKVLWTFTPPVRKGRVRIHSSPAVVDNQLFIGAMHQVQTQTQGLLYCISISDVSTGEKPIAAGELVWKYSADNTLKPVFSSPSLSQGQLFFGEGYHQDAQCRLLCLNARDGAAAWTALTQSHVESSPTIDGERVYIGAGDDGLLCYSRTATGEQQPLWQLKNLHVDAAPLVAQGQVVVGSVLGDIQKDFAIVAVNAQTGKETWRVVAPYPVPGSPALAADGGSIYVGLGRGKMDHDADEPAGAVWRINLAKGEREWEFPLANAVLGSPVVSGDKVLFGCRDGFCYCVNDKTGDLLWKRDCGAPIVSSPAVTDSQAIVLTTAGILVALDQATGSEQWRLEDLKTDDLDAYSSPVVVGGKIYVAISGKVHCVGEE